MSQLLEADICDLVDTNRSGSGPGAPSLAVVRPAARPEPVISERDGAQLATWRHRAEAVKNRDEGSKDFEPRSAA